MSEKKSHTPEKREIAESGGIQKGLEGLKAGISVAPVFAFLETFDSFAKKKKKLLVDGEVLFSPGESPYFYIVSSGALKIFRINPSGDKKEIGKAYAGSFLGEGVLAGRETKDVQAEACAPSAVVMLTKEDFEYLESLSPETLMLFYKHLNDATSTRLGETGKELALLYETSEKINSYKERGQRGLLDAIELLKKSLSLDYVIAVEQHPAVPNLLIYKFNTRFPSIWPINQKVGSEISASDEGVSAKQGEILGTAPGDSVYLLPLRNGGELRGFLVLGKKRTEAKFSDYEIRIAENLAPLFSSMIENNQRLADDKARAMMSPY
ncbi:MAG: Cyclic nucleotide-binding protein [Patescibacteria group bacterium]|nr:Cyclic nucleotide-binding protein [Patescibacteria group bacterium]